MAFFNLLLSLFYPLLLVRLRTFIFAAYQQRHVLVEAGLPTMAKEVYTDFKGNAYSLIFFESNEARESFLSFKKKPVFENNENAEGDDYYAKLNNNCYVESTSQ